MATAAECSNTRQQHTLTAPGLLLQKRPGQRLEEATSPRWSPQLKAMYEALTDPTVWMRPTAQEAAHMVQAHLQQLLCAAPPAPVAAM